MVCRVPCPQITQASRFHVIPPSPLPAPQLKSVLMAIYFGGDNIVWASQAGILQNKTLILRAQKASLYGWAGGSVIGVITELHELQGRPDAWDGIPEMAARDWQDRIVQGVSVEYLTDGMH